MTSKILFVCLGNICRSPLAEGIFIQHCQAGGLEGRYLADSAGIGDWHIGHPPDSRAIATAQKRGVHLPSICRQVKADDFQVFDFILAMDRSNHRDLLDRCPKSLRGKIQLMREYDLGQDQGLDVPDPYYGGPADFDAVFEILHRCCRRFLDALETSPLTKPR